MNWNLGCFHVLTLVNSADVKVHLFFSVEFTGEPTEGSLHLWYHVFLFVFCFVEDFFFSWGYSFDFFLDFLSLCWTIPICSCELLTFSMTDFDMLVIVQVPVCLFQNLARLSLITLFFDDELFFLFLRVSYTFYWIQAFTCLTVVTEVNSICAWKWAASARRIGFRFI